MQFEQKMMKQKHKQTYNGEINSLKTDSLKKNTKTNLWESEGKKGEYSQSKFHEQKNAMAKDVKVMRKVSYFTIQMKIFLIKILIVKSISRRIREPEQSYNH